MVSQVPARASGIHLELDGAIFLGQVTYGQRGPGSTCVLELGFRLVRVFGIQGKLEEQAVSHFPASIPQPLEIRGAPGQGKHSDEEYGHGP